MYDQNPLWAIFIVAIVIVIGMTAAAMSKGDTRRPVFVYQAWFCHATEGRLNYPLGNGETVDCLMEEDRIALAVNYQEDWAHALGRALHYGQMTRREPGVLLIIGEGGQHYIDMLAKAATGVGLHIFLVSEKELLDG